MKLSLCMGIFLGSGSATATEPVAEKPTVELAATEPVAEEPAVVEAAAAPAMVEAAAGELISASSKSLSRWGNLLQDDPLGEIYWTVAENASIASVARHWGMSLPLLLEFNPNLTKKSTLHIGQRLCIYRASQVQRSVSLGSPNRSGRLRGGVPLPEGPSRFFRKPRDRVYGTRLTVSALVSASDEYIQRYPAGPPVTIGDLSKRKGRHLFPHRSHRSGRDVDIGYIQNEGVPMWSQMNAERMNVEKTWFFTQRLIASGVILHIYMDRSVQEMLYAEASKTLSQAELDHIFQYPRRKMLSRAPTVLRHWQGHRNHMHVRFECAAWNRRCRGPALGRKKRKKRKKK